MYTSVQTLSTDQKVEFPEFRRFAIEDRSEIEKIVDQSGTISCEYSFANLFAWQDAYQTSWTRYQGRLLVYDAVSKCAFMPLGEELAAEELAILSLNLKNRGMSPDLGLATQEYIKRHPDIEKYYTLNPERDHAEYIYDVEKLSTLSGTKLHKKRNLISQFKRRYPEYEVRALSGELPTKAHGFARRLMEMRGSTSKTLEREMVAIDTSFAHFKALGLEGLAILVNGEMAAFSVFSKIGSSCYDIHFEKTDIRFKGAAQVINNETAKYLSGKCRYLNREQDLGIKGLRQAKMSYEPAELLTPVRLIFNPPN